MTEFDDNIRHADHKDVAADEIELELAKLEARRVELLASFEKCKVTDEDTAGRALNLMGMMDRLIERADNTGQITAQPYGDAVALVKARVGRFQDPLYAKRALISDMIDTHRKAVRAKIAEQQAEQAKVITPAAEIPRGPVKAPTIRGDLGGTISDRSVWEIEIVDVRKVPDTILLHADVQAAIKKVAKIARKLTPEITGLKITEVSATTKRKA